MEPTRMTVSYCMSGLPVREQLVFKSLMRLLAPRLQHEWTYQLQADLIVVGDLPVEYASESGNSAPDLSINALARLRVGVKQPNNADCLHLPIQANLMEQRLNSLGREITARRASGMRLSLDAWGIERSTTPSPTSQDNLHKEPAREYEGELSLKRWPQQHLLRSAVQIRMATVLLRRQTTLQDFVALSGQSAVVCQHFLQELKAANLLQIRDVPAPTQLAGKPASQAAISSNQDLAQSAGLISRIRRRLGL